MDRFRGLVARLEQESAEAPGAYRAKVAGLTVLGFGVLAVFLGALGLGLLIVVGAAAALALTGTTALILLAKFGKFLLLLVLPLWYLVRGGVQALFIRLPAPQGRELTRSEAPEIFAALDDLRRRMRGPRFHHVLLVDDLNAAVVQRPAFGVIGWPRNYLLLGLPLLESMPPQEALAVVAHEYGHLAGAHGHFSAFVYRLRLTWATIDSYAQGLQGWLARLVTPLVRWYAPYFNAYTFVLARADEYQADADAARLVGPELAASALKRVSVVAPLHGRFMEATFSATDRQAAPPADLMQRWAQELEAQRIPSDASQWLRDSLDRQGSAWDTHPPLRARLRALGVEGERLEVLPAPLAGPSAAEAWLGHALPGLRREFGASWAQQVEAPWADRHLQSRQWRERLDALRNLVSREPGEEIEYLQLVMRLEPQTDVLEPLVRFNSQHSDHAVGLFLEGSVRLDRNDRDGLALLDRAMQLHPALTKAVCERAHAWLAPRGETGASDAYAARWSERDALEARLDREWQVLDPKHTLLQPHQLSAESVAAIRAQLHGEVLRHVKAVHVARRPMPSDPQVTQLVVGVCVSYWGRQRGRQDQVLGALAALEWGEPVLFVALHGANARLRKQFESLADSRL